MTVSILALAALAAAQPVATPQVAGPAMPVTVEPSQPQRDPQVATPVIAQRSTQRGVLLWRNIENGMGVEQLRANYPAGPNVSYKNDRTVLSDVQIIDGCQAKVNVMHPGGLVNEVVMRGDGSLAGRCSLKVITALSGKYGQPDEKDKVFGSILAREGKNYVWSREGITLQFKRYTNGALGGGGLFAASWELRYSANAQAIDL